MWSIIDNLKISSEDDVICGCDGCGKTLDMEKDKWYHLNPPIHTHDSVDYCIECGTSQFKETLLLIDRTESNIDEKPLIWPCKVCGIKMEGGFKWYSNESDFDICMDCYERPLDKLFIAVDKNTYDGITRSDLIFINKIRPENRSLPSILEREINEDRMKIYADCISNIVIINGHYGSYKEWTMFTDLYKFLDQDVSSGLLVNCSGENNGQIALLIIDGHGRCGITVIYDSIDAYMKEYVKWLSGNFVTDVEKNHTVFSGYLVIDKELETYYG